MPELLTSWDPKWKRRYNSPPDNLIDGFYSPALIRSHQYDRAVGFFSSSLLAAISPALDTFVSNGGTMRLITSPANLSDEDLEAMGKGELFKAKLQDDLQSEIYRSIPSAVQLDRLKLLTWMVASGRLEIRIALREHADHYSLFHEKIGVFTDLAGNWMSFSGSPNETVGGACKHSESFPLHRSWASEDQKAYAEEERDRINDVWNEQIDGVKTWTVNEWIEDPMQLSFGVREPKVQYSVKKQFRRTFLPPIEEADVLVNLPFERISLVPRLPEKLELHDYQRNAVNKWLVAGGRGIFAMATGTGKTITALAGATQASLHAATNHRPLLILVIVPLIDLVHQWRKNAEWFGFRPVVCHGNLNKAEQDALKAAFSAVRSAHAQRSEMVITTAGSLTPLGRSNPSDHFLQRQLARHNGSLLVIGDEMHSLGTQDRIDALPKAPSFTLGLSATPKRYGDEEGTAALLRYFGDPVVTIDIKDAIYTYKTLVEYDYYPIRIDLTFDEAGEYRKLSARIAAAYAGNDLQTAEKLIRFRNRLKQHAINKLSRLRELMRSGLKDQTHQIIYVAEGRHPESDLGQLDQVEQLLRNEFDMKVARYYGETSSDQREALQQSLARGDIQALLAMKCLDEGVDIPSVRVGIITASTQNPRQFVQRRGRLLRRDPNSPKSHAVIYDFIVLPPLTNGVNLESEKTLIGAELSRSAELADAARNREVLFDIREWAYHYQLDPEKYTWMELSGQEPMQEWIP
ncbi:helicase-related protein [Aureliella helgolandensis]|uniref:Type III restriction enzyme, res subunit n=1 Tax=Aureliella helgolandensis TaxID=2527968 RepID=A0A518G7R6_9BACT|nr:helicase-related protein [Aureliella helgolandensis]QDV24629.1 Type III restriction enzyme, res subunit [Aureliella helgolandensis]